MCISDKKIKKSDNTKLLRMWNGNSISMTAEVQTGNTPLESNLAISNRLGDYIYSLLSHIKVYLLPYRKY